MSTRKLLTNGNAFKRTDNRWGGVVWYMDEQGERKRKSFSGTTKAEVNKKMTEYIAAFNDSIIESQETKKRLRDSMQNWLEVFKFPSVERTTYDRYECTAKNQIYPYIGDKVVDIFYLIPVIIFRGTDLHLHPIIKQGFTYNFMIHFMPPFVIKISKQHTKNRICQKQNSL